ncbi:hypothetical protein FSP39_022860 [Pinctada imbricata]|uniref:Centromere protein Q n=1 Tax=Pinctada imbricata TaxID=66713 RepID=A0AA89BWE3_PINIB|nr:hypothetical protein FSP39_022860 [Pinctada imbricata]
MARTASQKILKQRSKAKQSKRKNITVKLKSKAKVGNHISKQSTKSTSFRQNTLHTYAEKPNSTHGSSPHSSVQKEKRPSKEQDSFRQRTVDRRQRLRVLKEDIREAHFYQHEVEKWRNFSESTLGFLDSLIETAAESATAQQRGRYDTEAQSELQRVKDLIMGKLRHMEVPRNTMEDYRKISSVKGDLLELREKLENQEERIENAITREEESIQHLQEVEEKLVSKHMDMEVHPLLETYRHVLDIPRLGDS